MNDQSNSDSSCGLADLLDKALEGGQCEEALRLVNNSRYKQYFDEDSAWDLIPVVSKYVSQKTLDETPDLVHCCEELLVNIGKRAHPEESLLEFIELAEHVENNVLFLVLLNPMQMCLKRKVQRGNFLQFCLNAIEYHIVNQKVLQADEENGDQEELLAESDLICKKVTELYLASHEFCEPFVSEIMLKVTVSTSLQANVDQILGERKSLICFIMHLLGKPLALLDFLNINPKTAVRTVSELLVFDLTRVCSNLLMFLEYAEIHEIQEHRKANGKVPENESYNDIFLLENKVPTLSIGVLYYLIYVEEIMLYEVPCVYDTLYILQISMYLSTLLLQESNRHIVEKGLKLADALLCRVQDFEVPSRMLELPTVEHIVKALTFTIVYCPLAKLRQVALKVFKTLIFKFDQQGRYLLMCNIHPNITHSGLLGYLITELKELINVAISVHPKPTPFSGNRLFSLLKLYCTMPDVALKDILNVSSQITASLNLLRFLVIRDKQNVTGIWDHLDYFEEFLFEPLRQTIDLSRESIGIELQDILKTNNQPDTLPKHTENCVNMSVTVAGKEIRAPCVDDESTAQQLHSTLNVLDVMASVLYRVKECIQFDLQQKKVHN